MVVVVEVAEGGEAGELAYIREAEGGEKEGKGDKVFLRVDLSKSVSLFFIRGKCVDFNRVRFLRGSGGIFFAPVFLLLF